MNQVFKAAPELPLASGELSGDARVRSIDLEFDDAPPPSIGLGRTAMNTDVWRDTYGMAGAGTWLGLIDTGVRATHQQFTSAGGGPLGYVVDCRHGDAFCNPSVDMRFNPNDWYWTHGTPVAAIIASGLSGWGANWTGVSRIGIDSFNVWGHSPGPGAVDLALSTPAVVTAFLRAVAVGDAIIVANIQPQQGFTGAIASAAEDA